MTNYDLIGDIYGHTDKLEELLQKLGYQKKENKTIGSKILDLTKSEYLTEGKKNFKNCNFITKNNSAF